MPDVLFCFVNVLNKSFDVGFNGWRYRESRMSPYGLSDEMIYAIE